MKKITNILGNGVCFDDRFVEDHEELLKVIEFFKNEGKKIVYTSGVYDLFHLGHARYLQKARECGDILVLEIDTDEFVQSRKGPDRPIVKLEERLQILAANRSVDILTTLNSREQADELIKKIHPDFLVVSHSTKDKENFVEDMTQKLGAFVGKIVALEPQAETSTTARVRTLAITGGHELAEKILHVIEEHKNGGTHV